MPSLLRLRELFDAAVALAPEQRHAFVLQSCGADESLRAQLEALLACDAGGAIVTQADDPLAASIAATAASHFDSTAPWIGQRVGNYRILHELGRGGMGSVYLAERDDREYESRVAIKLILGFPSPAALERLRRERQVLAGLVHPHIARLLDGGTTPEGQPYLVIEYVDGLPLARWWAERRPPLALRLRLFQQLCQAVHHAHQNLIVHRDLKPANVMVRADDTPALLDFGIAKLTAADASAERVTELRAFTVDYASPEQLSGAPVTTASDIYGLGLILYELLCGKPYKSGGHTASWRESRPARVARQAEMAWVRDDAARMDGDLDHLVRKALAEEPERRYSSAAAMAAEIERYLAGLPLEAGPDRLGYRFGKFVRRHRVGVAAAALALAGMLGLSAWLAVERARAFRAERLAQREARTANQVTEFLLGLFKDVDPENARGRDISARELLDKGSERLAGTLGDEPAVRSRLLGALGTIYTSLGRPARSVELINEALSLARASGADPRHLAQILNELCRAYYDESEYAKARASCEESLSLREASLPAGDPDVGHGHDLLGLVDQGQGNFAAAERHYRQALAIFAAAGAEHREDVASTSHNLAFLSAQRGDYAAARGQYAQALETKRALYGDAHPLTLNSLNGLAQSEQALGDLESARGHFEQVLALRVKVQGAQSVPTGHAHNDLAAVLQDLGDYASAEQHYRIALELYEKLEPADSMDRASTANNLATLYEDRGDYADAQSLFERSLDVRKAKFSATHPSLARAQHNLARCLIENGNAVGARPLLDAALATRRALPAQHAERYDSELLEAEWQLAGGHADVALAELNALAPPAGRGNYRRRARHGDALARASAALGDVSAARAAEQRAFEALREELPPDHPLCAQAAARLARYLYAAKDEEPARSRLQSALPVLRRALVAGAPDLIEAENLAARLVVAAGTNTGQ